MEQALRQAQKMEALGRLTVGVAHDFNNHLTVISSNVEMVARRLDADQARLLRHTDAAMQGVRRAAALTGRLLSFSRQPAPEPEAVDVDRLVHGSVRPAAPDAGRPDRAGGAAVRRAMVYLGRRQPDGERAAVAGGERARSGSGWRRADHRGVQCAAGRGVRGRASAGAAGRLYPDRGQRLSAAEASSGGRAGRPDQCRPVHGAGLRAGGRRMSAALRPDAMASLRMFLPRHVPPAGGDADSRSRTPAAGRRILVVEDDAAIRAVCVETLRGAGLSRCWRRPTRWRRSG